MKLSLIYDDIIIRSDYIIYTSNIYRRERIAVQNEANRNVSYHTFATRATKIMRNCITAYGVPSWYCWLFNMMSMCLLKFEFVFKVRRYYRSVKIKLTIKAIQASKNSSVLRIIIHQLPFQCL